MKKIYKYKLPELPSQVVSYTANFSSVLSIQNQPGQGVMMWCELDDGQEESTLMVIAVGTGMEFAVGGAQYLGTAIDDEGYVWHYYGLRETSRNRELKMDLVGVMPST